MKFDENDSVRYLMGEMDPSEELLFEQKIAEDEDLLIEVESMRKVVRDLSELPKMDPPRHISRNVLLEASSYLHRRKQRRIHTVYLSAAATILVLFVAGALVYPVSNEEPASGEDSADAVHAEGTLPVLETEIEQVPGQSDERVSQTSGGNLDPWVDNNQELHFMDQFTSERPESFDSLLYQSFQRLQPVQESSGSRDASTGGLHLTGQGR